MVPFREVDGAMTCNHALREPKLGGVQQVIWPN